MTNKNKTAIAKKCKANLAAIMALALVFLFFLAPFTKGNISEVSAASANSMKATTAKTATATKADESTTTKSPTAIDYLAEYEAILYDSYDGLVSAEINAVAQTTDGYIWVGTYSGLYRYDGYRFEKMDLDERISNVMALFVDSKGRLWIGTNDSGLGCYEPDAEKTTFYTTDDGLSAYSIRSLCEDDEGNLYVGTVSTLCVIGADGAITNYNEWEEINGIRSLSYLEDGVVAGVTNSGILFFLKGDELLEQENYPAEGVYYTTVSNGSGNELIVGTSAPVLEHITFDGEKMKKLASIDAGDVAYYNDILYDEETDGYFFCAENGMGFLNRGTGKLTFLMQNTFESSVSGVIKDYQGNIWFVSNKQGIIEYSRNPFMDVFVKAGLTEDVVNSIALHGDELYIGTDVGLKIINRKTYRQKHYAFEKRLDGARIRHIMVDSNNNLWISTYGIDGLLEIHPDRSVAVFNESAGTIGGRFRYCLELSDGTVLAASNMGLSYIKDEKVIKTVGEQDGLEAAQILTMVECEDGSVLAGSDGSGIYRIKDGKIIGHTGVEEGLETLVVLRIVPCHGGFLYVTSNALYFDDGNHIARLDAFPYTNNYDVYISEKDEAWISSSAGIYIVRTDDLISNKDYHYTLLDYTRGFTTSLTANAWNAKLPDGDLLLCCTDGVRQISPENYDLFDNDYYIRVNSITYDDKAVHADPTGTYNIPKGEGRIQIQAAVLNYTLSNPLVHLYLEGAKDEGATAYQENMATLNYTNLPYGTYTLHVQILDGITNEVQRDDTFAIYKQPMVKELLLVQLAMIALGAVAVGFVVYRFIQGTIIRRQYEQIREAKEEAERANGAKSRFLANMSHEIRTPINTIMGMDQMILREDVRAGADKYVAAVTDYAVSIQRASESLLGLVNDILDLSKIESGKMNLVEQEYDAAELLRAIAVMIRVRSDEKGLDFFTEIDPSLPKRLYGDDGKIKQVVLNLLTNAVKYTEEGSFTLQVRVVERSRDDCLVHFSVKDTGIGIKPEDMDKLFSAFERLEEKRNSNIQGTGLGLDISKQFVELMGDELRCESVYGEGSTFYFTIRQKIVDGQPIGEFVEKDNSADGGSGPYVPLFVAPDAKILVVDDSEMNLQVLGGLLRATRVQMDTAMSGKECLEKLAENDYHIVLLDHMMPEMDGVETLHELRKTHPDIPTLALTANAATSGENYYISEGFQGYLSKPVDGRKLEEALQSYLPDEVLCDPADFADDFGAAGGNVDGVGGGGVASASGGGGSFGGAGAFSAAASGGGFGSAGVLAETSAEREKLGKIAGVDGLNRDDGVRFCGSEGAFVAALQTFYDTLPEKAAEIEDAYRREDYNFYTIKVHALKSGARIVGIGELSELAERLEDAGKAGDVAFIAEHTDELLSLYRSYQESLAFLGNEEEAENDGREPIDGDTLADAYMALDEIVPMMDYDSVEMILELMKEFRLPESDAKRFKEMDVKLRQLDWDGIAGVLAGR